MNTNWFEHIWATIEDLDGLGDFGAKEIVKIGGSKSLLLGGAHFFIYI